MKRATITDVAEHAGVSRTTVSLVLADAERIPDATKARVRASMDALGYVYNRVARAARVGQSSLIGLLLTDIRNPFFADLTMALDQAAGAGGLSVLQGYSFGDAGREVTLARSMAEHLLGGLVLLPTAASDADELRRHVASQPLVQLLRRVPGLESDFVGVDNRESGRLLGEHLRERNPGRVVLVGERASQQFRERQAGLGEGLRGEVEALLGDADAVASGLRGAGSRRVVDAVVTYNDTHLLAVLRALRDAGRRPGGDVAVASFDNTHISADAAPGITAVDHHAAQVAQRAVEMLSRRLANPGSELQTVLVPPSLVVRESTGR